jgi:Family of unknown function (DUF5522)
VAQPECPAEDSGGFLPPVELAAGPPRRRLSCRPVVVGAAEAIRRTHAWFERNSGWSPPDPDTLADWLCDGVGRCPDECLVSPAECCSHGLASWWLVLRTLDRPNGAAPLPPVRLVPDPDRLDPRRSGEYVAAMDAHHNALLAGAAGYLDPASGLFVQTARTLWDRGTCCEQGCRHCPFGDR